MSLVGWPNDGSCDSVEHSQCPCQSWCIGACGGSWGVVVPLPPLASTRLLGRARELLRVSYCHVYFSVVHHVTYTSLLSQVVASRN